MDILSMQIANKVLKRMNTEFNGLYDIFIATAGQKVFTTTKTHDVSHHSLHIYVNGYHAVENEDYTHVNESDFEFKTGLRKGDIVLASTQVVGIPKFDITNPEYDDTAVKNEIVLINKKIADIITALDDNGDGTIIDTIANIKNQWESADGDLITLIAQKATTEELAALVARVNNIESNLPAEFDPTALQEAITKNTGDILTVSGKVQSIEQQLAVKDLFVSDELTGRQHKIVLSGGVLSASQVGAALALSHTAPAEAIIGELAPFKFNILAGADVKQKVKVVASYGSKTRLEYNNGTAWDDFTTLTIESLSNLVYNMRVGGTEEGMHEVSFRVLRFENNHELGSVTFSVNVKPLPSSIISGTVVLNGANHENVLVNLQKEGDENTLAVGMLADGLFSHKVHEAGNYTLSITNGTDTHTIVGEASVALVVELGTNYSGNTFTLEPIVAPPVPPTVEDFIAWAETPITPVAPGEFNENPYQLMQINFARLQEVESSRLTIVGVGNTDEALNKQFHATAGAITVNQTAMFQWSYRDLSTLLEDESNLAELERTNATLLPAGTALEISIAVVAGGETYSISMSYTITESDVTNATFMTEEVLP